MKNIAGPPVEGNDFFGREAEINAIWGHLQDHDVLLLGPRRIGKTSISRMVCAKATQEGWKAIEVTVASCTDEAAFVAKLAEELRDASKSWSEQKRTAFAEWCGAILSRIRGASVSGIGGISIDAPSPQSWISLGNELVTTLLSVRGEHWLIYLDELPIFLYELLARDAQNGVLRVRQFLDWFRNDVRGKPGAERIHWLVSGSVGLDTLAQRYRMADTLNTFRQVGLAELGATEAEQLLRTLADGEGMRVSSTQLQRMIQLIGWAQPFYLQLAFNHLRGLVRPGLAIEDSTVDTAVDQFLQPGQDNDFLHWKDRLRKQLGPDDGQLAIAILNLIARESNGELANVLLNKMVILAPHLTESSLRDRFIAVRDVLIRDAYITSEERDGERRYRFRLEPLRKWWRNRDQV